MVCGLIHKSIETAFMHYGHEPGELIEITVKTIFSETLGSESSHLKSFHQRPKSDEKASKLFLQVNLHKEEILTCKGEDL